MTPRHDTQALTAMLDMMQQDYDISSTWRQRELDIAIPQLIKLIQENEMPIEPIPGFGQKSCDHPEHNPPSHICIPYGHQLRHTCPACGKEQIVRPLQVTMRG